MYENNNTESSLDPQTETLVERAARGDTEAFGCLYDIYADRIYRHIFYRTSNINDAQDLTQEVFVKAWQGLPKYKRTKIPFAGWLFTISHNRIIDYYRTKKDFIYLNNEIIIEDHAKNPQKLVDEEFTQQEVRRAILQLPEEQQQVIMMSLIEGFKYSEIAATLDKSEGNIRVIIHRALKKMREILNGTGN
ncbi:MAG: RNA polymerase sigma factor [Dehalococcoidales bacterium]|nr:MAG: RNA polymerase sigma factor [Dehalococcoidales bacterium]